MFWRTGLKIPLPPQERDIRRGHRRNAARGGRLRIDIQGFRAHHVRRGGVGMGRQEAREPPGNGCLADAGAAAENPGVRKAPGPVGIEQQAFRSRVAEQRGLFARMQCAGMPVAVGRRFGVFRSWSHQATAAGRSENRDATSRQMRSAIAGTGKKPSTTRKRAGSALAIAR